MMDEQTCHREGCNQPAEWYLAGYCSKECEGLSIRLAFEKLEAQFDADRDPSDVTMQDLLDGRERAKRWTPETMQRRIEELREAAAES